MAKTLDSASVSLRAESRLTERSQTTIPAVIRDALHLKPGEYINYTLLAGGAGRVLGRYQSINCWG